MTSRLATTDRATPRRGFSGPHRPLGLRAANRLGGAVRRLRPETLTLEAGALVEAVVGGRADAGRLDLGSGSGYRDGLGALVESLEGEAALTPAGRYFARGQVLTSLSNRLALAALLERHPELPGRPLAPAIVVVGLPRSGTTLLQHLLARDPDHRVLAHWEAARPAAPRGAEQDQDARRATARTLRLLDYLAPDARALHPVDTDEPTECVTLLSTSFASLELATNNHVPAYLDWCLRSDLRFAYEEYALQLRALELSEHRARWLLKSPAHLFWMEALGQVLGRPCVIQIHRDPAEVLGSFCSLAAVLAGIGSDDVDLPALGNRWAPAWAEGLARARAARSGWPAGRWVDLAYPDLVRDPLAAVEGIYGAFGIELTGPARQAMSAYLATHRQHARGVHRYELADFALDEDRIRELFGDGTAGAAVHTSGG